MKDRLLIIDGSMGEGGGQILRSSLSLSLLTGRPFRIENIRANRKKSGLLRQHLTAIEAARQIGAADTEGATQGSRALVFRPREIIPGTYHFAVGTAGSATLVLQTVLPPLLTAATPSSLTIEGGTHNPLAPPYDFLARSFLPLIRKMGPRVTTVLDRLGFFPIGNGQFRVRIEPTSTLEGFELIDRGVFRGRRARAVIARLPEHIAERELTTVRKSLGWNGGSLEVERVTNCQGQGNVLLLEVENEHVTEIFTGFGRIGLPAEAVARQAIAEVREYLDSSAPAGKHLADQLLLPLALAGEGAFETLRPSKHTLTNIEIIKKFLDVDIQMHERSNGLWRFTVRRA